MEIPFQETPELTEVMYTDILLTVIRGNGSIVSPAGTFHLSEGDQVELTDGDQFGLSSAPQDLFVVQLYWSPR